MAKALKEEKSTELAVIDLDQIDVNKLPELANFKERGQQLVKECVFVEIKDNASYELAKKNRTALRTFRTDVEKSDKAIKSKLNNFKNRVGEVSASLIAITEPSEVRQQSEIYNYEEKKEQERLEKLRLEQERIDGIKKRIGEFHYEWSQRISQLEFSDIEEFEEKFTKTIAEYDTSSLAEFEVLFTDNWSSLTYALSEKKSTLVAQEQIRLEQVRLAEEREKQRIENERIAEEQRKERERIEAEQKAEAEKIRLAKEQFEKEKREFEEKQAEAKFQERKKHLIGLGMTDDGEERLFLGNWFYNYSDIKNNDDCNHQENVKNIELILKKSQETESDEPKSDESANEKATETSSIGHSTRHKANTPMPEKELTWGDILTEFNWQKVKEGNTEPELADFVNFLRDNYNVPTRKIQ